VQFLQSQADNPGHKPFGSRPAAEVSLREHQRFLQQAPKFTERAQHHKHQKALKYRNAQRAFDVVAANLPL
jgi:hypothetical protein